MVNLQNCGILGIKVKFEKKKPIKWAKVSFVLSLVIAIGGIATMPNNYDWGILFAPLILFFLISFLIVMVTGISVNLKISVHNKQH